MDLGLGPRRRDAVARHLAACEACRADTAQSRALAAVLDAWSGDVPEPPPTLEADTLRRMRLALADEAERGVEWRRWLGVVVAPLAVVGALALALRAGGDVPLLGDGGAAPAPGRVARPATPAPARTAAAAAPTRTAQADAASRQHEARPAEVPPDLLARPDLFIRLPMLRHLDKLQHYEAIEHAIVDDGGAAQDQSHG